MICGKEFVNRTDLNFDDAKCLYIYTYLKCVCGCMFQVVDYQSERLLSDDDDDDFGCSEFYGKFIRDLFLFLNKLFCCIAQHNDFLMFRCSRTILFIHLEHLENGDYMMRMKQKMGTMNK